MTCYDVKQKIEKTLNNPHNETQKRTNNAFRNAKKHPNTYPLDGDLSAPSCSKSG